ncbi:hypothetical protein DFJ58DRAFT_746204 [Suillus subalutaceus]|uniref:uncharacterized protein n=1 Tax=Suillus subalutaceus TaxID=48586 RepID=UPI001B87451B|nr:uncharacterized protein DFJ58DRAFT_746204 [Suillus subalutaceus]KAG1851853.1 hypothetical protein DFJ58DRAFT_746204 [Suillus subalutaceus]
MSFSADGKLLATGCEDKNAYAWDVAAILREAGLDNLLSDPKANKSALHANTTRRPVQRRPPYRAPQGFFDGVPPDRSYFSARSRHHSSALPGSTLFRRLFRRSPSNGHDSSPSSPLQWAQALLKRRGQSCEGTELQGCSPAVIKVPYAKGKRPNATQQSGTATPSQTHPSSQPQPAVSNSSTAPAVGDNTAATTSTPSHPDVMFIQAGFWARFWLFIGCLSPEYQDGHH